MTSLDWLITVGSFGCFMGARAWLCLEADRRISAGVSRSPRGLRTHNASRPLLSAWQNAESGASRCPQYVQIEGANPSALAHYEVTTKCPVVTPLATTALGNTRGSRPGRILTGAGALSEKLATAGAMRQSSGLATRRARRSFNRRRYSLAAWLQAGGILK